MLNLASNIYRLGYELKKGLYTVGICGSKSVPRTKIICVGNLSVGGTGKTPFVIYLASKLAAKKIKTVVVSRGYLGTANKSPVIVSDGTRLLRRDYREVGDEPLMIASSLKGIPVLIGRDRYNVAKLAQERFSPQLILLDDGFQHWRLARDMNIVLFDTTQKKSALQLIPAGRLREPLYALSRADVVVLTKCNFTDRTNIIWLENIVKKYAPSTLYIHSDLEFNGLLKLDNPENLIPVSFLKDKKIIAFCGIANPEPFFQMLKQAGAHIIERFIFSDHHKFSSGDVRKIEESLERNNAELIVMTEKDAVKLEELPIKKDAYYYTCISPTLWENEEEPFWEKIYGVLK